MTPIKKATHCSTDAFEKHSILLKRITGSMCLIKYRRRTTLITGIVRSYVCPEHHFVTCNTCSSEMKTSERAQSRWHGFNGLRPPVRALKAPAIDVALQRVSRGAEKGSGTLTTRWVSAGPNCCHMKALCTCDLENRRMEMWETVSKRSG